MSDKQTDGREANGAIPGGKPEAAVDDAAVKRTGQHERQSAGPDGPDPTVVGDTFKTAPAPGGKPIDKTGSASKDPSTDRLAG